ncbi:hypothetical protein [Amphibacillus sediminis]|uniref:hypothetical protein n=1 Tax=Amphibacillus sediminis TaxID=360185 RepID=UPI000832B6A6|nr:hypothetical protein [Amphibacillus sediminis]
MAKLYISLIKTKSPIGRLITLIKRDEVTHAAISLDKKLYTLHGFGRRSNWIPIIAGFRKETYSAGYYGRLKTLPGIVLEMDVTEAQYNKVAQIVSSFAQNQNKYHYSITKLISNLFNKEIQSTSSFICSEFVAYVLEKAGIMHFTTPLNLVRPQILLQELRKRQAIPVYQGDMKHYRAMA